MYCCKVKSLTFLTEQGLNSQVTCPGGPRDFHQTCFRFMFLKQLIERRKKCSLCNAINTTVLFSNSRFMKVLLPPFILLYFLEKKRDSFMGNSIIVSQIHNISFKHVQRKEVLAEICVYVCYIYSQSLDGEKGNCVFSSPKDELIYSELFSQFNKNGTKHFHKCLGQGSSPDISEKVNPSC